MMCIFSVFKIFHKITYITAKLKKKTTQQNVSLKEHETIFLGGDIFNSLAK